MVLINKSFWSNENPHLRRLLKKADGRTQKPQRNRLGPPERHPREIQRSTRELEPLPRKRVNPLQTIEKT